MISKLLEGTVFACFAASVFVMLCSAAFLFYGTLVYGAGMVLLPPTYEACSDAVPNPRTIGGQTVGDEMRDRKSAYSFMHRGFRVSIVCLPIGGVCTVLFGLLMGSMGMTGDGRPRSKEGWLLYVPQEEKKP
jgi:hypothetical protein